jgi:hypothetical protein
MKRNHIITLVIVAVLIVVIYTQIVECQDIDNGKMCQHIANKVL